MNIRLGSVIECGKGPDNQLIVIGILFNHFVVFDRFTKSRIGALSTLQFENDGRWVLVLE